MNFLKRMGSASSSVRAMAIDQTPESSKESNRKLNSGKDRELKRLNEQLVNLEVLLEQVRKENEENKANTECITKQLQSTEGENERLTERNRLLEEQLESFESSAAASYDISESLKLKDQEISKLHLELQSSQDSLKSLKQKYKAKVQSMKASYSKAKQEQSLKIFELKDEISILQQENKEMQDELALTDGAANSDSTDRKLAAGDSRSTIIIELSTQISDQEYRISTLESQLEEKDLLITKLQSGKLSPRDAQSLIAIETEKTSQEMQSLAKELKMLKRQKRKDKSERQKAVSNGDYLREVSSLSRDSGALDLSSPKRADNSNEEPFTLCTPSHSNLSFSSSSTLVT